MAAVSFYSTRDGGRKAALAAGSQTWTQGTNAPGSGDIEIRLGDGVAWTRDEIKRKLHTLVEFLLEGGSTAYPL